MKFVYFGFALLFLVAAAARLRTAEGLERNLQESSITKSQMETLMVNFSIVSGTGPAPVPVPSPIPPPPTGPPPPPTSAPPLDLDGTWEIYPNQNIAARHEACFVMVPSSGKAYLMGGRETQDVDIFDPETRTWSKGESAPEQLHHMQCVEIGGKIYLPAAWTSGFPQEDNVDVMYVYNTMTDNWEEETAMPEHRRRGSAAIVVDGTKLWVSHGNRGGHEKGSFATSYGWIDYYDTATKTWVMGDTAGFPDAPNPRDHTGGGLINGRICVSGGRNGGEVDWPPVSPTDCFNPATKSWSVEASIPVDRSGSSYGTSCDGRLIIAGGESDLTNRVDVFDGTTWETFDNGLNQARHGSGLAIDCQRNLIYIASGSPKNRGGNTNSLEIYFPDGV